MASSIEHLQTLRATGLPSEQAEAIIRIVEERNEEPATREDITELRQWCAITFATQLQLAEVKVDLIKWMCGMALTAVGIGLAGVYFLLQHLKP